MDKLLAAAEDEVRYLLSRSWRRSSNNEGIAARLNAILALLKEIPGYDIKPYIDEWEASYRVYKADGGRAQFRRVSPSLWHRTRG